jgi:hypothetical protein
MVISWYLLTGFLYGCYSVSLNPERTDAVGLIVAHTLIWPMITGICVIPFLYIFAGIGFLISLTMRVSRWGTALYSKVRT